MISQQASRPPDSRGFVPPALALRAALLGALAVVLFGVMLFRLWYLQILSGSQYLQQANANRLRELPTPAPRGEIVDRQGSPLVENHVANAVQIAPSELPQTAAGRQQVYRGLGRVLHMRPGHIRELVGKGYKEAHYAPVTIKTDAGPGALTILSERQSEFPGVIQQPVWLRSYPFGEMAAQVLGYVGQINEAELTRRGFRGVLPGTVVGQAGLEYYYDSYLRGKPGAQKFEVNAAGEPEPATIAPTPSVAGSNLKISIELGLQRSSEAALIEGIAHARAVGKPATSGAFVAMDPLNGELLALGSYPSFKPSIFAKPHTEAEYKALTGAESAEGIEAPAPLTDRATEGLYPTGSTFKPITAMAALQAGILNPNEGLGSGQCITVSAEHFCNAGKDNYGSVGLVEALKVSSDTYFFTVGERANAYGDVIQRMAHTLGVGEETGVDLPNEIEGVVPDARWREEMNHRQEHCLRTHHGVAQHRCGYVSEIKPWSVGENMDLAVGQGALQTSPLQMATAYSTLVNAYRNNGNGWKVTPHLGLEIDAPNGALLQRLSFPPQYHVHLNAYDLGLVFEGIHRAASEAGGTSAPVWSGWNQAAHPVYGKTGTAEVQGKVEQSWYMCYVADPTRPIVIAVTIPQGGFGAEAAAPVARLIASSWFGAPKRFIAGSSKTN
jgi:penicillin-binding protein 2